MVLSKLKSDAERYLGTQIRRAVITVPAYFTDAQRHAMRDAGVIVGLHVERIINEPTAAATAYGVGRIKKKTGNNGKKKEVGTGEEEEGDDNDDDEQNVLVFDLGGGTFDVTLLTIDNGVFEVLATNGDTHLGGSDVDQNVMSHYVEYMRRRDGIDVSNDRRALQKLRREVERAKRSLSYMLSARLEIEDLVPGYDFADTLTRARFEEMNEGLFRRTLGPVKRVMEDAGMGINDVHQIILVGGSTRIPWRRRGRQQWQRDVADHPRDSATAGPPPLAHRETEMGNRETHSSCPHHARGDTVHASGDGAAAPAG